MRLAGAERPTEMPSLEQLRDEVITEKPDIYSFAGIVCDMLCGTPPLETLTADAAAAKQAPPR